MNTRIKTGLKGLVITIVLFVAIVLVINTSPFDEELNPEIKKIMQDAPMPIVKGNAYYALMGINAKKDKDIVQTGYELIILYQENLKRGNDELTSKDYQEILGVKNSIDSNWKTEFDFCDARNELNCLSHSSQKITTEFLNNPRLQTLLKRYDKILQMNTFDNFIHSTWNTPLASYGVMLNLSQIKLASAYQPQNRSGFLLNLYKDMAFWKMHLNQGKYLIDKMIAFAGIGRDLHYLSEYIRSYEIDESDHSLIKDILTPLSKQEIDLSQSFIAEARSMFNTSKTMDSGSSLLENLFFQPNATSNTYYERQLKLQLQQSKVSIAELIKQRKSNNRVDKSGFKLHYLYNFIGKTLLDYRSCACSNYIVRGHDLINFFKMVNIQFQAKLSDAQTVQQLLLKPNNHNPINNKPFDYNEESKLLQFDCLDNHLQCQIKL